METKNDTCLMLEDSELDEVPITPSQYNDILDIQQNILYMLASHGNTANILTELCKMAERLLPNSVASIMIIDETTGLLNVISAPSILHIKRDVLKNLKPSLGGGSCGNAIFRNEPQFVKDTFTDKKLVNLRQISCDSELCSCWSMPIRDQNKNPIGTFTLSSFEERSPALFHKKLLETAASIVNIVLKNQANEKRLKLFSTAAKNASEGMIITNKHNKIIEVNEAFEKIYGFKESDVIGKNPNILGSGKHNEEFYKSMWDSINNNQKWSGEVTNVKASGEEITQWMSISILNDEKDNVQNYLAIFSDLTELKYSQDQIEYMAYHDSLTHLCNKTYLEQVLKSNKPYTLILLNVNNFSYINTAYGFEVGDKLLIKLAEILRDNFDTKSTCHINADEFAMLFNSNIDIKKQVSKIQNYFYNTSIIIENITLNISFTYGAVYGNKDLLRNSALALKQAKEKGKNHLYIYNQDKDVIDFSHREAFIASNNLLYKALDEDRIITYFQGIQNNKTKKIDKFEVLVRIENDGEIISPYLFLEPARLSGMIPEITKVVIDKSFKIMASNEYTFSINLTEDDLSKNYLIDYLDKKALEHNIHPSRVILEILEGVSATGKTSNFHQLNTLKSRGYALAIDDFGAEYSNFERVLDLDIDYLKIDAKYIKDIHINPKSYEITRAIAFFAKNANIPCVAEFVHNEEVQKVIETLGIDYSQGFYFSEPKAFPSV